MVARASDGQPLGSDLRKEAPLPRRRFKSIAVAAALLLATAVQAPAFAHCDGLDGPVVTAARDALEAGDPDLALIWVRPGDEAEVRAAFAETLVVRQLGPQAQALADRAFFETLVRLHRAAEGAPYTGLQPAGRDLGQAIRLADEAVASESAGDVVELLVEEVSSGVRARLETLRQRRRYARGDLAAGREYVAAYVSFIHYVEGIHTAAASAAEGHYPGSDEASHDQPREHH